VIHLKIEKIKTVLLIFLVGLSIFLTSQLWFQPFEISTSEQDDSIYSDEIFLWDKIKPEKIVVVSDKEYTSYKEEQSNKLWNEFIPIFSKILGDNNSSINEIEQYNKTEGLELHFSNPIPSEIFIRGLEIPNSDFYESIKFIKKFHIPLNKNSIIIDNGNEKTYEFSTNIDLNKSNMINLYQETLESLDFMFNAEINGTNIEAPIPLNEKIMNPVIVKSEINIEDDEYITNIAKTYYDENYDYVRKSVENNSSVNYVYKNEKVLKVNNDGLLEFYNTAENTITENDVYSSLLVALNFTENFLGFPENAYLSKVENIQENGNFGYKFIFDYKILDRPIIFSQVRNERAVEIEVVGNEVVLYKRFIRVIDYSEPSIMEEKEAVNPLDIIKSNIDLMAIILIEEDRTELQDEELIEKNILESIEEIYLGYYDPSRKLNEQLIRSVWVVKAGDSRYIFNALTGNLVEIQTIE